MAEEKGTLPPQHQPRQPGRESEMEPAPVYDAFCRRTVQKCIESFSRLDVHRLHRSSNAYRLRRTPTAARWSTAEPD